MCKHYIFYLYKCKSLVVSKINVDEREVTSMETPERPNTEHRLKQYLQEMATTLSSLTNRVDQNDRIKLRSYFKQLLGLLLTQQKSDIITARADHQLSKLLTNAQRENASLMAQKRLGVERRVAKISHVRDKLTSAKNEEDRTKYQHILAVLEDMAADEECKWDLDIMSHWFEAFTKPCVKCVRVDKVGESQASRPSTDEVWDSEAPEPEDTTHSPAVRALELYSSEVRGHLSLRLKEVDNEISILHRRHHASYMDDVESTLSAIANIESLADVASIKDDVLQLRQLHLDINTQYVICTIVDKTREKYERAAQKSKGWDALLLRITEFRDSNEKRNDGLLEAVLKLTSTINREIDIVMAGMQHLGRGIDTLESAETRRRAQTIVQDLTVRFLQRH